MIFEGFANSQLDPGDIFEHAVVLSVKMEDQDAFERHFLQLKSYYTDTR
jgi:26S proteasome regulatory subunit N12